jgi:hypothetical protein
MVRSLPSSSVTPWPTGDIVAVVAAEINAAFILSMKNRGPGNKFPLLL